MKLFGIFDSKVEAFLRPFFARTAGEALRDFSQAVTDKDSAIGKFPGDFTLFELADFDEHNGKIVPLATPKSLGIAIEYINQNGEKEAGMAQLRSVDSDRT